MTTKKVLLVVNAEYGQANVFLAAGHALQALDKDVQIHFASFKEIANDVATSSRYSVKCTPGAAPWTFHQLDGPSFTEAIQYKDGPRTALERVMGKRPIFSSVMAMMKILMHLFLPWDLPEFDLVYKSLVRILDEVQPDITVVDSLFAPGLTACRALGRRHIVLSPNTLKDFAVAFQPRAALFWKFPVMGSAYEFPVPWRNIPANTVYCLAQIYFSLTDTRLREVRARARQKLGAELVTFQSLMMNPPAGLKILVSNRPEIDFPLIIPRHLTACGPLIRPVAPVADDGGELDAWLRRGPTVFISLGTHRVLEEYEAVEMARALRVLLDAVEAREDTLRRHGGEGGEGGSNIGVGGVPGKLQVLWKLKRYKPGQDAMYEVGPGTSVHGILRREIEADRVRIVDWVKPQPSAVLQAGTVVCSVNHGGANSFHDALTSAVPQVILPAWLDCYDFANRAEYLGIGRWGNKQAMPSCAEAELGPILVDVVLGPGAAEMRARVRDLADLCAKTPGATVAASGILDELKSYEEGEK
ncbi:glycosyltransferase family 1 protein [Thermothelomyces heterothallicus CBS 202.75]|uniref:glycosyltransferase family 1 protein n=1 Tax=Thermothelomyces heterothallicus CBS 202.75 TaxID=1149848 RepID=UPI0037445A8A